MKHQINKILIVAAVVVFSGLFSLEVQAQADPLKLTVSVETGRVSLSQEGPPLKIRIANVSEAPVDLSSFVFSLVSLAKSERDVSTAETARLTLPKVVIAPGEHYEFEVKINTISWYRERKPDKLSARAQPTEPYKPKLSGRHFAYATIMDCVKVIEPGVSEIEAPLRSCESNKIAVQVSP
jgi:hypothetical protein